MDAGVQYFMKLRILFFYLLVPIFCEAQNSEIPTDRQSIINGQDLFAANCSRCHVIGQQKIGPSLASVTDKRPISWLLRFIGNSQKVIQEGNPYAVHLFRSFQNKVMPRFPELSTEDKLEILAYIKDASIMKTYIKNKDTFKTESDQPLIAEALQRSTTEQDTEKDYYEITESAKIPQDQMAIDKGRMLFLDHCEVCHRITEKLICPALASVVERRPLPWLLEFIDSPRQVIENGDDYANFLLSNYSLVMPDFKFLSMEDKLAILAYIKEKSALPEFEAGINTEDLLEDDDIGEVAISDNLEANQIPDQPEIAPFVKVFFFGSVLLVALVFIIHKRYN